MLIGESKGLESSIAYLASFIKREIPDLIVEYMDARFENDDFATVVLAFLDDTKPSHVGITCYSHQYLETVRLARTIKHHDERIIIIVGGFHPTILPGDFTFDGSPFNYIVRGEGEVPLVNILNSEKTRNPAPVIVAGRQPTDLAVPGPIDFSIFDRYKGVADFTRLAVNFSRGCIYDCSFCMSRNATCNMKTYRSIPIETVSKQLEILDELGIKCLMIQDPLFGANKKMFHAITGLLASGTRAYKVKLEMHVDRIDHVILDTLISSGIDLTIGFESASTQMLHLMNKTRDPGSYVRKASEVIKRFDGSGQELTLNLLLGHPGETRRTIDETFSFLAGLSSWLNNVAPKFSIFRLYPGTMVYEQAAFFERVLKTRFMMKDWWYHDIDHSIAPCLVDPSASLTFTDEMTYIRDKIRTLFNESIKPSTGLHTTYKFFFSRQVMRIEDTHASFLAKASAMHGSCMERWDGSTKREMEGKDMVAGN